MKKDLLIVALAVLFWASATEIALAAAPHKAAKTTTKKPIMLSLELYDGDKMLSTSTIPLAPSTVIHPEPSQAAQTKDGRGKLALPPNVVKEGGAMILTPQQAKESKVVVEYFADMFNFAPLQGLKLNETASPQAVYSRFESKLSQVISSHLESLITLENGEKATIAIKFDEKNKVFTLSITAGH